MTGYAISLEIADDSGDFPIVQVWRRVNSTFHTRVGTSCGLSENDITMVTDHYDKEYYLGNVSCIGNNSIEFQSGDVIGYYQSELLRYQLWSFAFSGYTAYHQDVNSPLSTLNINSANATDSRQPMIQVIHGKNMHFIMKGKFNEFDKS